MSTNRTTALQGSTVRLKINFKKKGTLADPYSTGDGVTILNPSNVEQITDVTPTKESTGQYYIDFAVPVSAPIGTWTDS